MSTVEPQEADPKIQIRRDARDSFQMILAISES